MDAPKKIWAWSDFAQSLAGTWGVTRYPSYSHEYILAAEHERIVAEKDNAIKAARREAFEEAAKMADELFYPDETKISARIRDAIRALAEKE